MIALSMASREEVEKVHALALALGGADEGAPGPRGTEPRIALTSATGWQDLRVLRANVKVGSGVFYKGLAFGEDHAG